MSDTQGDGPLSNQTATVETEPVVIGYCVHCRTKRQMQNAIQVCNRRGRYDLKGYCAVCGKAMYRLGGWEAVAVAARRNTER
ncbi:DUF5679 domain-containing protein [Chthonomonas calidirosea]|uniref:DUF5679 domain-containing protein n=1 Tax=Chthonomonas calidirosea TaxID=454171 RepID=UPI0006ECC5F2|nr:DUF5679 domain-containing protein [Chthonomonas calidirosea]CEK18274.1 hypothetical protein CP488_02127 [Chthonomonas calidirosea]